MKGVYPSQALPERITKGCASARKRETKEEMQLKSGKR